MSVRQEVTTEIVVEGKSVTLQTLSHITVDDILAVEMKIAAYEVENGVIDTTRRVGRDVRDYIILTGVER